MRIKHILAGLILVVPLPVLASGPFTPGSTLDPDCLPTDPTCTVSTTTAFVQDGVGAVPTTTDAKLKDGALSARDFGAVGDDTHDDTNAIREWYAAVIASGKAGYLPQGTYRITSQLTFDLASVAGTGVTIYGDGVQKSVLDGSSVNASPVFLIEASGGTPSSLVSAFYPMFRDLGFKGNIAGTVLMVGRHDFSDAINGCGITAWVGNGSASALAQAVELNYTLNCDYVLTANNHGHGVAIAVRQTTFSRFFGSFGTADTGLALKDGYDFGNTFSALDLENLSTDIVISSATAAHNVWQGGTFVYDSVGIDATAGSDNTFISPNDGPTGTDNFISNSVGMSVISSATGALGVSGKSGTQQLRAISGSDIVSLASDGTNGWITNSLSGSALVYQTQGTGAHEFFSGSTPLMLINSVGNLGLGTTTPASQLTTTGTVQFANFGAGTLTTDANGNLSVSSDERLKDIDGTFSRSLPDIMKISPIEYHWNALSGLDRSTQYSGFSAQNMQTAIPEAVGSTSKGYLTLQDRPILATIVNALKDIASVSGLFKTNMIAWLGSAGNGVGDVTSQRTITGSLCLKDASGVSCYSRAQLDALVGAAVSGALIINGSSSADTATVASSSTSTETTIATSSDQSGGAIQGIDPVGSSTDTTTAQ